MRTYNNIIGNKIIDIVYEHNPYGIGRNELARISGFTKNTIDRWITLLRKFEIIKQTPKYPILLTELSIQKYRNNSLLIPFDLRRKNHIKEKSLLSKKDKKSIILILSLMALGVYKSRRYHKPKAGLLPIQNPSNLQQIFMYGGKTIHSVSLKDVIRSSTKRTGSPNKKAFLPNTKINYGNNELFGYLDLTIEEAERIFTKLLNHDPPIIKPLKINCKNQTETRYIIADDQLKEFVTNCILSFNVYVKDRLEYTYIYDLFYTFEKEDKKYQFIKKEQIKEYKKKYMQIWYGSKRKSYGYLTMMDKRKEELNIKNSEKYELIKHYKKVIDEWDENIKKRYLFDNKFENVNEKYKPLLKRYGFIVNIFLELLFPLFLRELWKIKN